MVKFFTLIGFAIVVGVLLLSGCSSFGTRPNEKEKKRFRQSKQFNSKEGVFQNRRPGIIKEMKKRAMSWKVIKEFFSAGKDRVPADKLPEVKPDIDHFLANSENIKVIWFGHSSFLLNVDGKIILVDPVFSNSASPVSWMVQRFQKPVLELNELPEIDYILISHDHYDHLDMDSIKFFIEKKAHFIAPLGVGSHLRGWGVPSDRVVERDWWETESFDGIEFVATPAQHFSGRDGIHENETLWASWVIKTNKHSIYFSGDSGYDTHFKEIGDKYGPFDVAFLETGQYDEKWREVHMLPDEGAAAYKDLKAKKYFPVHWAMFELALHKWYDPIEKLFKFSKEGQIDLVAPKIGQLVHINQETHLEVWWKSKVSELSSSLVDETDSKKGA